MLRYNDADRMNGRPAKFKIISDNQSIPIDKESVHYGGEAFVLQEFPAANGVGPNFETPHKWELTAEVKVHP